MKEVIHKLIEYPRTKNSLYSFLEECEYSSIADIVILDDYLNIILDNSFIADQWLEQSDLENGHGGWSFGKSTFLFWEYYSVYVAGHGTKLFKDKQKACAYCVYILSGTSYQRKLENEKRRTENKERKILLNKERNLSKSKEINKNPH